VVVLVGDGAVGAAAVGVDGGDGRRRGRRALRAAH